MDCQKSLPYQMRRQPLSLMRRYSIGVDVGGTKIRGVLWDGEGVTRAREFKTPRTRSLFVKELRALVKNLSRRYEVPGIGIGSAGTIEKTKVVHSRNIPYLKNFDFQKLFPNHRITLDNDARTFARAEFKHGAARTAKNMLALTLGTGIGAPTAKTKRS